MKCCLGLGLCQVDADGGGMETHRAFFVDGGYRGQVVRSNLKRAFPHWSAWQRGWKHVQFQRHFAQLLVESAKLFSMSRREVDAGMVHHGKEAMEALHRKGKHVLVAGGHMNNWEWSALTLNQNLPFRTMALYKKLSDKRAEKMMRESRSRFGLEMVRTKEGRAWMNVARHGDPVAVVMGFDQSPADPTKCWWTDLPWAQRRRCSTGWSNGPTCTTWRWCMRASGEKAHGSTR